MSDTSSLLEDIGLKICGQADKKTFILLYTASRKVSVDEFHLKCDGKGPTVTILYSKNNTIYGGYTSEDWSSDRKKTKADKDAFLFYKNDHADGKCTFMPIAEGMQSKAITCDANFGPTFGWGPLFSKTYDLQTFKKDSKPESEYMDGFLILNGAMDIQYAYDSECRKIRMENKFPEGNSENQKLEHSKFLDQEHIADPLIIKRIDVYQVVEGQPWRTFPTNKDIEEMKRRLEDFEPVPGLGARKYNILLLGAIASGKSSFFNTLATVFSGSFTSVAPARSALTGVTNQIHKYELKSKGGKDLNIQIFDIRGFAEDRGYDHELELILNGRLPPGYKFPEKAAPVEEHKLVPASFKNEMHLVCFVTGTSNTKTITAGCLDKINDIKKCVNRKRGLPMVVIVTKFDELSAGILEDANKVYLSSEAHDAVKRVSHFFGIEEKYVFPIVNYKIDHELNNGKDMLALQALDAMVRLTSDYIENHKEDPTWRTFPTSKDVEEMKSRLENFEPVPGHGVKKYNILLLGAIGSGKSSFFNTLATVFSGSVKSYAPARGSEASVTNEIYKYKLKSKGGKNLNIQIFDIRGFTEERGYDHELDIILNGRLPPGYVFPENDVPVEEGELVPASLKNEMHLVCFVTGTSRIDTCTDEHRKKIKDIKACVNRKRGLPMVVIVTKFDDISERILEDVNRVYRSSEVHDAVKRLSYFFGLPEKHIFPIVNYKNDYELNEGKDRLALEALDAMVRLTSDYMEHHKGKIPEIDSWAERAKRLYISVILLN